jgi:hypothetical protein
MKLPANTFDPARMAGSTISTGAARPGPVIVSLIVSPLASSPIDATNANAMTRKRRMEASIQGGVKTALYR